MLTWTVGGAIAGLGGILVAPFTGLTPEIFTLVVTVAALAAALLGRFESFPLTLLGGLVLGVGEAQMTNYQTEVKDLLHVQSLTGASQAVPFLVILLVLVVRGRALPLRSHVSDVLPRLGGGRINWPAIILGVAAVVALTLLVFDDNWATAMYLSLASGIIIASIVVLTGYAGQLSLAQWAIGGIGALIAARFTKAGVPIELSILLGIVLTIPAGMIFALPALRTRGVNLAVVTLGLGFTVSQVILANPEWIGEPADGGTKIGTVKLFGVDVDAVAHPQRWALVCLVALVRGGPPGGQPQTVADRAPAHRRAHERAGRRLAGRQRLRGQALRLRRRLGHGRHRRHPRRVHRQHRHLRPLQPVPVDQRGRPGRDRRHRLRARPRVRRAERHRRHRHEGDPGLGPPHRGRLGPARRRRDPGRHPDPAPARHRRPRGPRHADARADLPRAPPTSSCGPQRPPAARRRRRRRSSR